MNFYAWAGLINAVTCLVAGLFVWSRHERDLRRITFVLFMLSVGTWAFFYFLWQLAKDRETALFFARALCAGAFFAPVTHLHHVATLVHATHLSWTRRLIRFGYASAFVLLLADPTPLVVREVAPRMSFPYWPLPGPLWHFYTGIYFGYWLYTVRLIWHGIMTSTGPTRNGFQHLLLGTLIAFAGASMNFLPWYDILVPPIGTIAVPLYTVLVALAAIRYQFMDLKITVTLTGLLLGIYLIVLGFPFMVGWWGRPWLEQQFGQQWWLVPLGLCTALATAGPFAYAYLRRQVDQRLLREQRRYQWFLQHAARGMTRVHEVTTLARLITRTVSRAVRVQHASLFLWDTLQERYLVTASHGPRRLSLHSRYHLKRDEALIQWFVQHRKVMSREDAEPAANAAVGDTLAHLEGTLVIPGFIEKKLVGFLVLGEKLSGAGYSVDDLHAFATLANEAAIAVENAHSYEELLKAHRQLKASYDRLVQQERLVAAGQFAMGVAHEIKNPLSSIKTFTEFLPERYKDPVFREKFFRIVQEQIDRIAAHVKELSDFAKPAPLQLQPVHLPALVQDILALLHHLCLAQRVEVTTSFQENGLMVQADPNRLKQVLLNLFLNSLEAMENGGSLTVETQANHRFLLLRVRDTGCGISPQHLETVWDPFFTTKERGMGLGLPVVKDIVERHGGAIHLSSSVGHGTTFELSLPLAPSQPVV